MPTTIDIILPPCYYVWHTGELLPRKVHGERSPLQKESVMIRAQKNSSPSIGIFLARPEPKKVGVLLGSLQHARANGVIGRVQQCPEVGVLL